MGTVISHILVFEQFLVIFGSFEHSNTDHIAGWVPGTPSYPSPRVFLSLPSGRTPLLTALMAGAPEDAVSELLEHGEDPGIDDDVGRTSLEAAVLYCSAAVVKLVLEACMKKNKSIEDDETRGDLIEIDKDKLLRIGEDHAEPVLLREAFTDL